MKESGEERLCFASEAKKKRADCLLIVLDLEEFQNLLITFNIIGG